MPRPVSASTAATAGYSTYDVLIGEAALRDAIVATAVPRLHLAPSTLDLSGLELEIGQARDRAFRLRNALAPLKTPAPERKLQLRAGRLPAVAQSPDRQRHGGRECHPGAAAMRVLRARRSVATAQDRRAGARAAQSGSHHPRHRADHVRRAQQSVRPGGRRRARVHGAARSTTPSSRATCGCRKRRPTASRCWSTISNAAAAKPICGSRPRSSSARRNCAPDEAEHGLSHHSRRRANGDDF